MAGATNPRTAPVTLVCGLDAEVGLPARAEDGRGVGEVLCAMVEFGDVVATVQGVDQEASDLLTFLQRPDALHVADLASLDGAALAAGVHDLDACDAWVAEVRRRPLPTRRAQSAWELDFRSERPFHPERLYVAVERLGGGPWRSRGCFWLPTRPDQVGVWDGAGGQLSFGAADDGWGADGPLTRIVVVGVGDGREELRRELQACLLTDEEMAVRGPYWEAGEDGYEPWFGPVRRLV